jgi:hypothetical protein
MSDPRTKLNASAKTTEAVSELTRKAALVLREGYDGTTMVNAYGVFANHRRRKDELLIARGEIDKALALIDAAPWPSEADYNSL